LHRIEQRGLRRRLRVEPDQQKSCLRWLRFVESSFGVCSAQCFRKLRLGEDLRAGRAAFELAGPAGERACVCVRYGSLETVTYPVGM